jgi:pyruvate dehydrogenase E1 component alpha subunit
MVWQLPVIFVVEDNGWGEATSSSSPPPGDIVKRAQGYGMRAEKVDGCPSRRLRGPRVPPRSTRAPGHGPTSSTSTERFYGHFNGDTDSYRSDAFKAEQRANRDCLCPPAPPHVRRRPGRGLRARPHRREVEAEIESAVQAARAAEQPDVSTLTTDVYVSYEGRL